MVQPNERAIASPRRGPRTVSACAAFANLHVDGVRCGEEFRWADPRAQWRKGLRDGDAGPDKDTEIEFPSYGRTPSPERKCCINMLTDLGPRARKQIRHVRQCLPAIERCHTGSRRVPAPCCRIPSSPMRFCLILFRESHIEPDPIVGHDISPRIDGLLAHDASRHRHFGLRASWLRFTLASVAFMEKFN